MPKLLVLTAAAVLAAVARADASDLLRANPLGGRKLVAAPLPVPTTLAERKAAAAAAAAAAGPAAGSDAAAITPEGEAAGRRLTPSTPQGGPTPQFIATEQQSRDWVRTITGTSLSTSDIFNGIFQPVGAFWNQNNGLLYMQGFVTGNVFDSGGSVVDSIFGNEISLHLSNIKAECGVKVSMKLGPNDRTLGSETFHIASTSLTIPADALPQKVAIVNDLICTLDQLLSQTPPPPPSGVAIAELISELLFVTSPFLIYT